MSKRRVEIAVVALVVIVAGVLVATLGQDGGGLGAFCRAARAQRAALTSGDTDEALAAARALAESAPADLRPAAEAYVAAMEAEAEPPSGDGLVDAAALAESMEAIEEGRGPAASTLMQILRVDCGVEDLDL